MSMIWRSAMPLLTTLAALVIIVHCVEEDLKTYRQDLRPRVLDTRIDDQPWRVLEESPPVIQEPRNTENWNENAPDDVPKRRRPGRKRKRRPQTDSEKEFEIQERFAYPDEPLRPYLDYENSRQTTEMPKRRRKKQEEQAIRWVDDDVLVVERPIRQRGNARRKRPSLETWPELSEFGHYPGLHDGIEDKTDVAVDKQDPQEKIEEGAFETDRDVRNKRLQKLIQFGPPDINEHIPNIHIADDKSLSEFSMELVPNIRATRPNKMALALNNDDIYEKTGERTKKEPATEEKIQKIEQLKCGEKVYNKVDTDELRKTHDHRTALTKSKARTKIVYAQYEVINEMEGAPEVTFPSGEAAATNYPMDPVTLKEILKKSNGTSLSEILQQHNLSLTDLLSGKENAVSIFRSQDSSEDQNRHDEQRIDSSKRETENKPDIKEDSDEGTLINFETKFSVEPVAENFTTTQENPTVNEKEAENQPAIEIKTEEETLPKPRRRYPISLRKKMRIRPVVNVTNPLKAQLSRDILELNARKYLTHRRNNSKSKEWKDVIQSMKSNHTHKENNTHPTQETTTVTTKPEETTIPIEMNNNNNSLEIPTVIQIDTNLDDVDMDVIESTTVTESTAAAEIITENTKDATEKPDVMPKVKPTRISNGRRLKSSNNRVTAKRLKHKYLMTEPPQDDALNHLFGIGSLVSSSEFIARTQEPRITRHDGKELTTLEDIDTTEMAVKKDSPKAMKKKPKAPTPHTTSNSIVRSITEPTAKIEIEELLNDTQRSAKLRRILKERNMTLNELVEHRERGSSHVHLADIFHNASKEPNPPEPFLSKSFLEPISKETYPLRAILEANLHDANNKAPTIDSNAINLVNIPVIVDYRSNVNENAENMGIMSLFKNFTRNSTKSTLRPDFGERKDKALDIDADKTKANVSLRETRIMGPDDIVSWNEIFSLMRRTNNGTEDLFAEPQPAQKILPDEDANGDGLILLEDLQHLIDFDNNMGLPPSDDFTETVEIGTLEQGKFNHKGILDKIPSQTKSVTIATASIAGLAMILFLLTYAAFRWKQQNAVIANKRNFSDQRIPTPVFENRKGHKINSSTRSISPILQTSNIYTINTLDSENGKESPDYMWDSLRKPFQ